MRECHTPELHNIYTLFAVRKLIVAVKRLMNELFMLKLREGQACHN